MPHFPCFTRAWPIRYIIAGTTVVAMSLVAIVLISLSWFGAKQAFLDMAHITAINASQLTAERTRRIIAPGEAMLHALAFNPLIQTTQDGENLALRSTLTAALTANPLVSALYVGHGSGDFMSLRPLRDRKTRQFFQAPPQADYLVSIMTRLEDGSTRTHLYFYDAQHALVTQRFQHEAAFDPRTRPWYAQAAASEGTVTSGPYVFFTTGQVGITLSQRALSGQTIVGADITLADLGKGLASLRLTPSGELALVTRDGSILAYSGTMPPPAVSSDGTPRLPSLSDLDVKALSRLRQTVPDDPIISYEAGGEDWLGTALPFDGIQGLDLQLLSTAPTDELLGNLSRNRTFMVLMSSALILLLLPLGWRTGGAVGQALERLAERARKMSLFNFIRPGSRPTRLREVGELDLVMDHIGGTVKAFLEISRIMGTEPSIEAMLDQVLEKLVKATRCSDGAVYLSETEGGAPSLAATFSDVDSASESGAWPDHWPAPDTESGHGAGGALERTTFELRSRRGHLEGLLVLTHERDPDHASPEFLSFAHQLTGMLAMAIEARQFAQAQKALLDAFIRVLTDAIDAKSPYTGGHCERVPRLAIMLADQIAAETGGPYADFSLSEDERYEFRLAAWLHDCGKVTSPEHIIDKATKLEVIHNRIHEIRMRFEVLWRDAEIGHLQARLTGEDADRADAELDARRAQLQEDFRFIAQCNIGGEFLPDEAIERLRRIAQTTWLRHFDDSLGLSAAELHKLTLRRPHPPELPAIEQLLADKPEHIVPWDEARRPAVERDDPRNTLGFDMKLPACRQNAGELHNLTIRRGTLTEEDRFAINDHMVQTLTMLNQLPWPRHLARVPDIASNHHERMDGTGYPRRIPGEKLQLTERVMALVDVFEALTAADRPYKPAKTLSESLRIMAFMCKDGHLDTQLYLYFLRSPVWMDYARDFMKAEQFDTVDIEALARIAAGA